MNYLLIMHNGISISQDQHFHHFAIGIAYVSASLKQAGFNVFTANLDYIKGETRSILKDLLHTKNIDVLCVGGLSRDCGKIKALIDESRKINPQILTVVGGGIISGDPEPAMRVLDAEIGVIGEGEITMCQLAEALDKGLSYNDIAGLIFKDNDGNLIITNTRTETTDLDNIPFPDFDGFDYAQYVNNTHIATITCSRSCTHACTFCFRPIGRKYRQRSIENIMLEVDYQISRYHPQTIILSDNLFSHSKKRVLEFCEHIKKRKTPWVCSLHVADVKDAEMIRHMKDAGCCSINVGLESADDSVLKSMRKGSTVKQIEQTLDYIWNENIHLMANFIFGDVSETKESVTKSINFFHKHKKRFLFPLDPIITFPGSAIYKHACNTGLIKNREQYLKDNCPVTNISKLTEHEFNHMISTITELRLGPRVPAGTYQITKIQHDGSCSIEYICRKCHAQGIVNVQLWYSVDPVCPSCGTVNHIDPFQKTVNAEAAFFSNLQTDKTTVMWGAGGIYYKFINRYDLLSKERFLVVDGNKDIQGLNICKKRVLSPEIIRDNKITNVIITALSQKDTITTIIGNKYPTVNNILTPTFNITTKGIVPTLEICNLN